MIAVHPCFYSKNYYASIHTCLGIPFQFMHIIVQFSEYDTIEGLQRHTLQNHIPCIYALIVSMQSLSSKI